MLQLKLKDQVSERPNTMLEQVADICLRWKISEFALFGSILRDDFRPDSDVDILVTFEENNEWSMTKKQYA